MNIESTWENLPIKLKSLFRDNLYASYCVKSHFIERFSEIFDQPDFLDLSDYFFEVKEKIQIQFDSMKPIYHFSQTNVSLESSEVLTYLSEALFFQVQISNTAFMRYLTLCAYINQIADIESSSFKTLQFIGKDRFTGLNMNSFEKSFQPILPGSLLWEKIIINLSLS